MVTDKKGKIFEDRRKVDRRKNDSKVDNDRRKGERRQNKG